MRPFRLNRRAMLRGAGSVAIALPWLEAMTPEKPARAAAAPAKRFIGVYTPGGTVLSNWRPTGTEEAFTLSPILQPLAPVKERILVMDGIDMPCAVGEQNQPPADVPVISPPDPAPGATLRERLTVETQDPLCQGCHRDINPAGFAFEHYDAAGKWRDTENGHAIDSSGELYKTDAKGKFNDAIELLAHVAESNDAKACFVARWQAEAYRRAAEAGDACATEQVSKAFVESDGDLVELMVALAKSDNFRFRLKSELQP